MAKEEMTSDRMERIATRIRKNEFELYKLLNWLNKFSPEDLAKLGEFEATASYAKQLRTNAQAIEAKLNSPQPEGEVK